MAYPVILVNSATGSDSAASGAGPSTALTGSAGVSTGTTVVLDGSPNLTGVATDGTHVLWFNDTTAGNRNFSKITGTANSGTPTAQVTVADAFATTTKAWAIGGKRASVLSATSIRLWHDGGGSAGDMKAGWTEEMQSGHTESYGSYVYMFPPGDDTNGPVTLRGTVGAATKPILTMTADSAFLGPRGHRQHLEGFEIQNTSGAATDSRAIDPGSGSVAQVTLKNLKISHATNFFKYGLTNTGSTLNGWQVIDCEFGYTGSHAIYDTTDPQGFLAYGNYIHDGGGIGINFPISFAGQYCTTLIGNVIARMSSHGVGLGAGDFDGNNRQGLILQNTIDSCGGDGVHYTGNSDVIYGTIVANNNFTNNSGYGVNFVDATAVELSTWGQRFYNNFYNNSSGTYFPSGIGLNDTAVNPNYVSASTGDFTPANTTIRGASNPPTIGTATNYQWIGAIQALVAIAMKRFFLIPN
jgi:hypothetical protein